MPILSAAELATLWSPPTPDIAHLVERVPCRPLPAPATAFVDPNEAVVLGTAERSDGTTAPIGLKVKDFRFGAWITAPVNSGKSTLLARMIHDILKLGYGCMACDNKGTDLIRAVFKLVPLHREKDVVIIHLGGTKITGEDMRVGMNLLSPSVRNRLGLTPSALASVLMTIFVTLDPRFQEAPGMRQFAQYGLIALSEGEPRATWLHLIRFFNDEVYREEVCGRVKTEVVRNFWLVRFPELDQSSKVSLQAFERRLDQLLAFPELAAMFLAPGCSVDLRDAMDHDGIVLAGIRASEGPIAEISMTLLLTQLRLAALSRDNIHNEDERRDWPVFVDEVQIIADRNEEIINNMLTQLRAFHVGLVVTHQNADQVKSIYSNLANNVQTRSILAAERDDAMTYERDYKALGVTKEDFVGLREEPYSRMYLQVPGSGQLFLAGVLPQITPLDEPPPPDVYVNWQTIRAAARTDAERELDAAILRAEQRAKLHREAVVKELGLLAIQNPAAFGRWCERRAEHRAAQRKFILDNPGCIPRNTSLPDRESYAEQKRNRIEILSVLRAYIPEIETAALAYGLLYAAEQSMAEQHAAETEAKAKGKGKDKTKGPQPVPGLAPTVDIATVGNVAEVYTTTGQPMPSYEELVGNRGRRRPSDHLPGGFADLEGDFSL